MAASGPPSTAQALRSTGSQNLARPAPSVPRAQSQHGPGGSGQPCTQNHFPTSGPGRAAQLPSHSPCASQNLDDCDDLIATSTHTRKKAGMKVCVPGGARGNSNGH